MAEIITPTNKQFKAIEKINQWFFNRDKPFFVLAGVAGSGKSTCIQLIKEKLSLKNTVTAAYTGMATCVLIKKGNLEACTIHRLIYDIKVFKNKQGKEVFKFEKKDKLDDDYELIIIDEYSMVDKNLIEDLLSFEVPILFVGDPEQLEPIFGSNGLKPDFFLDEVLRQSLDNPIIWLSNEIRHKNLSVLEANVQYGDKIRIYSNDNFPEDIFKETDQIIALKNKTVNSINDFFREYFLDQDNKVLNDNEKVMCLKNNWKVTNGNIFLVNGLIGRTKNVSLKPRSQLYKFDLEIDFSDDFNEILADKLYFDNINEDFRIQRQNDLEFERLPISNSNLSINNFKFAYCTTLHKYQGSQAKNITGLVETYNYRWLYTLVTRAEDNLNLILN